MTSAYIRSQNKFAQNYEDFLNPIRKAASLCDELTEKDLPPEEFMQIIGSRDKDHFVSNMKNIFLELATRCRLTPSDSVLDLGCGCGRLAFPFKEYLKQGRYYGVDVWEDGIEWCKNYFRNSVCNFQHLKANDNYYYSTDDSTAENSFDLKFIRDGSIDLVFAISVFTHLKQKDCEDYFSEVSRVLKSGAMAYLTFFIIDEDFIEYRNRTGEHTTLIPDTSLDYQTAYQKQDFFAGLSKKYLENLAEKNNLKLLTFETGTWAEKRASNRFQDLAIFAKL